MSWVSAAQPASLLCIFCATVKSGENSVFVTHSLKVRGSQMEEELTTDGVFVWKRERHANSTLICGFGTHMNELLTTSALSHVYWPPSDQSDSHQIPRFPHVSSVLHVFWCVCGDVECRLYTFGQQQHCFVVQSLLQHKISKVAGYCSEFLEQLPDIMNDLSSKCIKLWIPVLLH